LAIAAARNASNVPVEDPKSKAQSLIDSLPGNNLISKTAILSTAAGLSVYAISNEYYVVNEESIVAFCLICVWTGIIKYGGPQYKEWAQAQHDKIRNILNSARAEHVNAVKERIGTVQQMQGVVETTKSLFAISKVGLTANANEFGQTAG
jgi:F-type H+-transporting ATPase subunit b